MTLPDLPILRSALGQFRRHPGFHVLITLILGLGIGSNTAMFSIVHALLFQPLPLPKPDRLIRVYQSSRIDPSHYEAFSYPNYADLRERAAQAGLSHLAAFRSSVVCILETDRVLRVCTHSVSSNYFAALGVGIHRGRGFSEAEERDPRLGRVVLVSHRWWRSHGADGEILGRLLTINGVPHTIIGITPPGFAGHDRVFGGDLWLPLAADPRAVDESPDPASAAFLDRRRGDLRLLGRLMAGVKKPDAEAGLRHLADQLAKAFPAENRDFSVSTGDLPRFADPFLPGPMDDLTFFRVYSTLLLGLSAIVLVIAGWNVANLLLARAEERRREMAIRQALGSGRARIVGQLLTEGLLLSLFGAAISLVAARWVARLVVTAFAGRLPWSTVVFEPALDVWMIAVTLGLCALTTVFCALRPAWNAARRIGLADLKDQIGDPHAGREHLGLFSARSLRVASQLALCSGLVLVAAQLIRQNHRARSADPGFPLQHRMVVDVHPALEGYSSARSRQAVEEAGDCLRRLPGVDLVGTVLMPPFSEFTFREKVWRADRDQLEYAHHAPRDPAQLHETAYKLVDADGLRVLGLRVLRGRGFTEADWQADPPVRETARAAQPAVRPILVDELLARQLWPGEEALGRRLALRARDPSAPPEVREVVGIVPAIRERASEAAKVPHFYAPTHPGVTWRRTFVLKISPQAPGDAAGITRRIWQELRQERQLPLMTVRTFEAVREEGLGTHQFLADLVLGFGLVAVVLASAGVYSLNAYSVARRVREIGVRVALGAARGRVLAMILGQSARLTALGLTAGILLAWSILALVGQELPGFGGLDPLVLAMVTTGLGAVSLLASLGPAWQATRIDPIQALRHE